MACLLIERDRPEVNIKPWEILKEELNEGNGIMKWSDREPYAYWKGNTKLGITRRDLVKCNASYGEDWKARIFQMVLPASLIL